MRSEIRQLAWCLSAWTLLGLAGCSDPDRGTTEPAGTPPAPPSPTAGTPAAGSAGTSSAAATKPAETPGSQADAEEAFIAPALADIDAQANWIDQPVANLLEVRRKEEQGTNPPVTASEALALRNDSKGNNDKITATLGRVAQSADEVDFDAPIHGPRMEDDGMGRQPTDAGLRQAVQDPTRCRRPGHCSRCP